jgi:hypothetical protein
MAKTYTDFIKELSTPTIEQTNNFVQYVATLHSWYKHLPSERTIPFVFYFDPNVAKELVTLEEGGFFSKKIKFKFKEIEDGKLAQDYLTKFGYWRYNLLENNYNLIGNNEVMEHLFQHEPNRHIGLNIIDYERFQQPLIFSNLKDIIYPIPKELIQRFTFNMSRYLHPTYKDSHDYFDNNYPEKSYAQMHKDIIKDLTEHLYSIVDFINRQI